MEVTFIAALTGLTSIGAYYFGARALGLSSASLGAAIGKMLETVGIVLIFLAVNLAMALMIVLMARGVTGSFVSTYLTDDVVWLGLSLIQGLAFQWWRGLSTNPRSADPRSAALD
jgi:hypothetical protein